MDFSLTITVKLPHHIVSLKQRQSAAININTCAWEKTDLQALNDGFVVPVHSNLRVRLFAANTKPAMSRLYYDLAFGEHGVHLAV